MKRKFFGMSVNVRDTEWNRLFSGLLLLIEKTLVDAFGVHSDNCHDFSEWSARAEKSRPDLKYLLEWIKLDSRITECYQYNLGDSISDELLDEINVSMMVFETMPQDLPMDVFCAEVADAIDAFECAFWKEESKALVIEEDYPMDFLSISWHFDSSSEEIISCDVASSTHEGAFSLSA